jgi:uncharacterized Zn-binding protein involved in type VI secretion
MFAPAARVSDMHTCPKLEPLPQGNGTVAMVPHVGGPILPPGAPTVLIAGQSAATLGDQCLCNGPVDMITTGSATVMINGKPAARRGDRTAHGGVIVAGAATVMIG